ncbi:hypothetical protein F0562_021477 [Nyssa sinensis]|uniref:Uncharacterized protein n=1 Tax=Nyssa sinensis TaxID=561372 RepID=A0A5J5BK73_9ASTE|nr:hypothetical protein F0562_021477 [Nyssa sinensis]
MLRRTLAGTHVIAKKYRKKDGVQLTASLYLPLGYDPSEDGPLPCLIWAFPGEFKSKDAAGQVRGSPNEFAGIGPTSPLLWLARRHESSLCFPKILLVCYFIWANNSYHWRGRGRGKWYVEQLVASADAAVEEVIRRGVAH